MNLSENQLEFLKLFEENPLKVLCALSDIDIKKPLMWRDSIRNGGKHGYRGIAKKYNISERKARTILKNIESKLNDA